MDITLFREYIQYFINEAAKDEHSEFPADVKIEPMLSADRNDKSEIFSVKIGNGEFIVRIEKR